MGIVTVPVLAAFPDVLPEIVPKKALPKTATFAGPPLNRPKREKATSRINPPAPEIRRKLAKIINPITMVAAIYIGMPNMPASHTYNCFTIDPHEKPRPLKKPGT
jgi:hypothetical protein